MKYMSWSFWRFDYAMKEIYDYGDRFYQVGMFDYITEFTFINPDLGYFDKENVSGITGKINLDVNTSSTDPTVRDSITVWNTYMEWVNKIREKWPHIKWFLSVRNDGTYNAIEYLMNNNNYVQDVFLSEIERLIDENPWCAGIDLDLEHCGGIQNADNMVALIARVSEVVHAKGKLLHYDLPAMNGEYWSIGSENWCSYERLNPYLDSVIIMSYDFAWQGSAPSAVSPKWWLELVYAYVAKSFDKDKVFMGLPGYGYSWQISEYPDPDVNSWYGRYRGHTLKYNELIKWQNGYISHTDTQAKIPFASYINDTEKCANMYLHVYDLQGYDDATLTAPASKGEYKGLTYVSAYKKKKEYIFNNTVVTKTAKEYTTAAGNVILVEEENPNDPEKPIYALTSAKPKEVGEDYEKVWGIGTYSFSCASGTYELILDINFTWFSRNIITVELDGTKYTANMGPLRENTTISRHYAKVGTVTLSGGTHTLKFICQYSSINALFYGFILCTSMTINTIGGNAKFLIEPQTLYDVNMVATKPSKYKITFEVLRRLPDYCYIFSDDFRSYVDDFTVFARYYTVLIGYFAATGSSDSESVLHQYSEDTYSEFRLSYDQFSSICVNAQFLHDGDECGIVIGNNKVGIRGNNIIIYNGNVEVKVIHSANIYTTKYNELKVRVKGTQGKIWINGFELSVETLSVSNIAGMYSMNASYECCLFEIRDSYNMYLQESITVTTPFGTEQLGRVERNVTVNEIESTIYVGDGIEESQTRTTAISDDWDFLHTSEFTATGNFEINVNLDDIGFWLKRVLLVDSEGASVAFYNDIFSYMYWFNECTNTYGFKGCGIWCTGEENPSIYQYLDKEV